MADDMEHRLMALINNNTERLLTRFDTVELDLRNLRTEHAATRAMVLANAEAIARLPVLIIGALEQAILPRLGNIETRLNKLERKPPPE